MVRSTSCAPALALALLPALAGAHGSLVIPPSRNNYQQKDPANATGDPHMDQGPCVGGACLWFSEGCFLGCPACSATMPAGGNQYNAPNCTGFVPTAPTLPEEFRTYNRGNVSPGGGGGGDFTRYHPWRSPGAAPVSDPCGVAGAYTTPTGGGGETPAGARQGDRGSALPPTALARWAAGGVAEVGFMLAANHGGGYHYALCPYGEPLGEACFRARGLAFADGNSTVRYLAGGRAGSGGGGSSTTTTTPGRTAQGELSIAARDVAVGTTPAGSTWRLNPVPACACDHGRACKVGGSDALSAAYSNCSTCDYPECGKHVPLQPGFAQPPFPNGYGQQIWNRRRPAADADDWVIVDRVVVPRTTGAFVLRWRWDTEQNAQVWTHCADVFIE